MRKVLVTPVLHPSAIQRGLWHKEAAQIAYLKRVAAGREVVLDTDLPPMLTHLYPSLEQLDLFVEEVKQAGHVAIDLETAGEHIICVGMTAFQLAEANDQPVSFMGSTLCLRFRVQGGGLFWERFVDHERAVIRLGMILQDSKVTKVFHNGIGFDVPLMLELGFEINGPLLDTMIMSHSIYSEMPRGLQFLSTLYLGMPVWKTLDDPKDDVERVEADDVEG